MLSVAPAQMNVDVILVLGEIYFNVQMQPLQSPLLNLLGALFLALFLSTTLLLISGNWYML